MLTCTYLSQYTIIYTSNITKAKQITILQLIHISEPNHKANDYITNTLTATNTTNNLLDWNFRKMSRIGVAKVEPEVASPKAMYDRTPTSSQNGTRVGKAIRNGSHGSCVGMDQDDFGIVKQANIGTSKMDHVWNQMMDGRWMTNGIMFLK